MSLQIPLTKGKFAIVDAEDYEQLSQWKWNYHRDGYAIRTFYVDGKKVTKSMHHQIALPPPGLQIDHKNLDGLDNRRDNLRVATRSQQRSNQKRFKSKVGSQYKGVHPNDSRYKKPWRALIMCQGKHFSLGNFYAEEEAAKAYDAKAKELFGEFAYTNFG